MIRKIFHRFKPFKRQIGNYQVKVEYIGKKWYSWVVGPVTYLNSAKEVIFAEQFTDFDAAVRRALLFVSARVDSS